ncbi:MULTISPECIES: DNA polymerase III subunit beta [Methylosinus]|uniref:Beta sliding clamp n=1 Tax=Methylosinus trichosporium (strain ATCC 35070 / NCIMB 11131 / UNIQEM 75 / OB3b) TaxID=595536 RepID=A0A2D2CYR5_METT3|nr:MULTISPECIES: DNA polymerase III subunit beta [Methylosinus]ATQ67789.1 DNA polymerase III subunit beta [Methylosinus trichosporium OB3b]OBS51810.1 DNA polymerase III subunit beta [Methylosinus sp. 3S-1]
MKLTIDRAPLLKALETTRRIAEQRTTIPILSHALLETDHGRLCIRATDLDIETRILLDAEIAETGALAVSAAVLHDLTRKLPEKAQITLEGQEAGQLQMRSGRSRFKLSTLPADTFPDTTEHGFSADFALPAATLARMLGKTAFAISTEETRYYLNGVFFHHMEDDGRALLRMVATDGHRLSRIETEAPAGAAAMPGVIVPRKACAEIERLLKGQEAEARLAVSANKLRFSLGDVTLSTKLIDGTFPDYARVIPQGNDKRATLDRTAMAAAADRVSTIHSERGRAVKLSFDASALTLSVTNPDMGEARDEMEADYDSSPIEIGFNSRYLAEALQVLEGDSAVIRLADPGAPTLFQSATQPDLLIVLMPMRV